MPQSDLMDYVANYAEHSRDAVVEQIMKGRLLKQAIETPAGKVIINSAIDDIHQKIMKIVGLCTKPGEATALEIGTLGQEIAIIFKLIMSWADILVNGEKHEEAMKGG